MICSGCGATLRLSPGPSPETTSVFHPEPLCLFVLAMLSSGCVEGPLRRATLDTDTGELVEEPRRPN